uniref:Pectinesterase inhibitor domain-containing protein n=1 Tax=Leersia perrieri TaxID=77586 RepID=A0A0D9W5H9_9ORYZ
MAATFVSFLLFIMACSHSSLASSSSSVVKETCAKATAAGDRSDLAPFCVATLQSAPGSDAAVDARGLAVIATNLTLASYTAAYAAAKALQRRGGWSGRERAALAACRRLYADALDVVHSTVHALNAGETWAYEEDMGVVLRAATGCEDAFAGAGAGGDELPLYKVDVDAINVATVAVLIVLIL